MYPTPTAKSGIYTGRILKGTKPTELRGMVEMV